MKILATSLVTSLAVVLVGLPLSAGAGNKAATSGMQVSFVVKEACTVQTPADQGRAVRAASVAAPVVACELNTPYLLTRGADPARPANQANNATTAATAPSANHAPADRPAAPIRAESGAQHWVVYF